MKSGKVTPDIAANRVEALPLGWTQINRGKKRRKVDNDGDGDGDGDKKNNSPFVWCCDDPTCSNEDTVPTTSTTKACPKSDANKTSEARGRNSKSQAMSVELEGKALFCLHSLGCSWFQGQFIPNAKSTKGAARGSSSVKSLGLLAKQRQDLDECLQCSDGGYREIDLTLLAREKETGPEAKTKAKSININSNTNNNNTNNNKLQERKSICVEKLSCTGGDMLQIKTPLEESSDGVAKVRGITVSFDADQIITGKRVAPLVKRYFSSLVHDSESEGDVLEQLPDCAIVVGNMKMTLPQSFLKNKANPVPKKDNDDDDDWLE